MSQALSTLFDYDVGEQKARDGMGHYWLDNGDTNECHWCGTRSHWPGARHPCAAQKDSRWGGPELARREIQKVKNKRHMDRAREIRRLWEAGSTVRELRIRFGMSDTGIRKIVRGLRCPE